MKHMEVISVVLAVISLKTFADSPIIASPEKLVTLYHSISKDELPDGEALLLNFNHYSSKYKEAVASALSEKDSFKKRDKTEAFRELIVGNIKLQAPTTIYVPMDLKVYPYRFNTKSFTICCMGEAGVPGGPGYKYWNAGTRSYRITWNMEPKELEYIPENIEVAKSTEFQASLRNRYVYSYVEMDISAAINETDEYDRKPYYKIKAIPRRVLLTNLDASAIESIPESAVVGEFAIEN